MMQVTQSELPSDTESFLGVDERVRYGSLPAARKTSWLLGRLAAKKVVHRYFEEEHGQMLALADIRIGYRSGGAPQISSFQGGYHGTHSLSVSHVPGLGVAAFFFGEQGRVGIDVETVREFSDRFLQAFLTPRERRFLSRQATPRRSRLATLLWCYKEAYMKAVGLGLRLHPQKLEISLSGSGELLRLSVFQKRVPVQSTKLMFSGGRVGAIVFV